jgi:hypothetical protein
MKLAEGLALRAEATRRVEQLRARIVANARYQEGEQPSEDAVELLARATETVAELEALIRRINVTNASTTLDGGTTITDALARRDALRLQHSVVGAAADAASGRAEPGYARQLRSELTWRSALPVTELREQADELARELRELDSRVQQANWATDLVD